ncbi:MAG: baseplate J/gp47 family protein [Chloroflexi bacterium]|nr:baseplate J/gp47 family protein [Chloroflexota bacterium]
MAQEVGLAVFPVTWLGKHIRPWHSVAASTFVPNADGDGLRVVIRHPAIARHHNHLVSVIIMAILILVAAGLTVVVVPSAQVTLSPVTEDVSTKLTILANPAARGISAPLGQIPARIEEMAIEGTESSVPVAKRDVPDARATGQIVATNKTDQPIHLSKGTVVATSSGVPIRFQTTADVDLPSKGRAEVAISAIEPGPTGNVARFTVNAIEGQYSAAVNVVNANPTSGGTVRRVPVVTEEDKRRLEEVLAKRLKQEAISKFQAKVKNQEFVAPDTVSVILDSKTFDKFVDEPADLLTLTAHATARGTFVYGGDANVVALKRLESNLRPGYALLANTVVYTPGAVLGVDQDVLRFELVAAGQSASMVDANLVAMSVRGMTVPEARDWIANQFSLRREPAIALQPDWIDLGRMPLLGFRISIEFLP